MRTFVRGFNIPLKVPAYVLNGAHGHRANDLHVQSSSRTWPANARGLEGSMFADAPSTHERARMCLPRFKNDTLTSCLRLVFKYRAPAQLRSAEASKIEGARTQRALSRGTAKRLLHKHAKPRPIGRVLGGLCNGLGKFAVFGTARSRSYAKYVS